MDIRTYKIDSDADNVTLTAYLSVRSRELPYNEKRDAVLVCPGGGYHGCSAREAEPVALAFQAKGYNTFILDYVHGADRVHPGPLLDLCKAVRMLKEKADEFRINPDRIFVIGFSAGAHLAASLGTMWSDPFLYERTGAPEGCFRVRGMILCYPVITSGKFCNAGSFVNLLKDGADDPEKRRAVSLETKVGPDTVPAYIWHTSDDPGVPVENSLLFASALSANRVPFELHVFPHGPHGMSLCDAQTGMPDAYVARWVDEAIGWMERT
ncbi:MAG: alpha/beta hydrolase [Clostridia bacterium]|nr:alpha/beta hydrolase [Clostridia bacterium]